MSTLDEDFHKALAESERLTKKKTKSRSEVRLQSILDQLEDGAEGWCEVKVDGGSMSVGISTVRSFEKRGLIRLITTHYFNRGNLSLHQAANTREYVIALRSRESTQKY